MAADPWGRGMTAAAPGGDVRGFYEAIGVELPGWAHTEAPVRCFADPDAHQHQDRDASCSVNLQSGAFNCHGCGAHGGAYDAALAKGCSPREAIDLMITHGLTQRRPRTDDSQPGASLARARDTSAGGRRPHQRQGPRDASPGARVPRRRSTAGVRRRRRTDRGVGGGPCREPAAARAAACGAWVG